MSENQLREAYTLMKQGDKKGAARLVQDLLREDKNNANAWWLFAHILEDEEKIVKSLERVLALNPEHLGARKKLAELRPEYTHLYQSSASPDEKEKAKAGQNSPEYWAKLHNGPVTQEKKNLASLFWDAMGIRIKVLIILAPFMIGYAIFFNFRNQEAFYDKNGDTPLTLGAIYLEAVYREDFNTVYAIACPEFYPEIDEMVATAIGIDPNQVTVDLSATEFRLFYQNGNQAFVKVTGLTSIDYGGGNILEIDWVEAGLQEDVDVFGEHFYRTDDVWQVCIERYVPNLESDNEAE